MGQVGSPPTTPPGLPAEQIQSPASDSQATAATLATTIAEPAQKLAARRLYEQAAAAIAESKPEQAIKPLEALQRQHPDSALSRAVLPHLVECYLAAKRADEALDLLIEQYTAMEQIAAERSQLLGRHACHALPATRESAERIAGYLQLVRTQANWPSTQHVEILLELASRYECLADYAAALACLQLDGVSDPQPLCDRRFQLQLAWGACRKTERSIAAGD